MDNPQSPKYSGLHKRCVRRIGEISTIHRAIAVVAAAIVLALAAHLLFTSVGIGR